MRHLSALAIAALTLVGSFLAPSSRAEALTAGSWTLYPPQATDYTASVQQPINADGSSNFKSNGNGVIPVKFSLAQSYGPVVFESIGSDGTDTNDYSFLSFTPSAAMTFSDLTTLSADYAFSLGNCHGGALRWSVRVSLTQSVFIYYGDLPNFTDCTSNNQSGTNMIGLGDVRYDTSQVGGTFYDTYAHAQALVGSWPIVRASLVLDGGWAGDQRMTVSNVTVNDNTFVPASGSTPTCDLPAATIKVTKISGSTSGPVNEPVSIQPNDTNDDFRIVDCKYMYNLATSSLSGTGRYKVEVVIGGTPAGGPAYFDLR